MGPARFLVTASVIVLGLLLIVSDSLGDSPKAALASQKLASTTIDFNRDIRPILSKNCFVCHGADEGNRKVKLRLDVREEATKVRKKGKAAIDPGHPEKSLVIKKITAGEIYKAGAFAGTGLHLDQAQILICTANSTGGVMGKMISPQNIATGVSVTDLKGHEGVVFARTFWHSIILTVLVGVLVAIQQYILPWMIPHV